MRSFQNNATLARTALKAKADPERIVILSEDESSTLRSVSAKTYFYYSNGSALRPLHLAAALGGTEICQMLLAEGAKLFAVSKGFDWVPAQYAAKEGHPDLAKILLGIDPKDDRNSASGSEIDCLPGRSRLFDGEDFHRAERQTDPAWKLFGDR
jgi:hypothetical protein